MKNEDKVSKIYKIFLKPTLSNLKASKATLKVVEVSYMRPEMFILDLDK